MDWFLTLPLMVLLHVMEDFHIQGRMADMKQKAFWKPYGEMYARDHIPVLLLHGFEWSMFVSLPILITSWSSVSAGFMAVVVANGLIHSLVDHLKCNSLKLSLVQDQAIHITQIVAVLAVWESGVI